MMLDSKIYNQLPVVAKITENKIIIIKKMDQTNVRLYEKKTKTQCIKFQ